MASNETTIHLSAYFTTEYDAKPGIPQNYEFNGELPTPEDAKAFAATFPKAAKMGATRISTADGIRGYVFTRGDLISNGVNGGLNETGLKRYQTILKAASKAGVQIEYVKNAKNAYESREAFEAAIYGEAN